MKAASTNLLRRLDPPVRPSSSERAARPAATAPNGFEDLLVLASRGELRSGMPVTAPPSGAPLNEDDQERLGEAADTAAAAGFEQALIVLDGRHLVIDVPTRRVLEEALPRQSTRTIRVDGAVIAPSREEPLAPVRGPACLPPDSIRQQIESAHHSLCEEPQPDAPSRAASDGSI